MNPVPPSAERILVVDDEPEIVALVAYHLGKAGYRLSTAATGQDALEAARRERFSLIVLDLMLPGMSGFDVLEALRTDDATRDVAVLMLTARREEPDRIRGLSLGADDYLTKPFSPAELVLRVAAILRRGRTGATPDEPVSYGQGMLTIDEAVRRVVVNGSVVELTPTEWGVLVALAAQPGRVCSRYELINRVRGYEFDGYERTVDSHVKNLRRKIEPDPTSPAVVQTVTGVGYRLGIDRDR